VSPRGIAEGDVNFFGQRVIRNAESGLVISFKRDERDAIVAE